MTMPKYTLQTEYYEVDPHTTNMPFTAECRKKKKNTWLSLFFQTGGKYNKL